jgi:hypothetical protein
MVTGDTKYTENRPLNSLMKSVFANICVKCRRKAESKKGLSIFFLFLQKGTGQYRTSRIPLFEIREAIFMEDCGQAEELVRRGIRPS